jgi:hypothetical protein
MSLAALMRVLDSGVGPVPGLQERQLPDPVGPSESLVAPASAPPAVTAARRMGTFPADDHPHSGRPASQIEQPR